MNRTRHQLRLRVQFETPTDETDASIGSGCGFHSNGAQQKSDDAHADGGTCDSSQEQLPPSYMIHDR